MELFMGIDIGTSSVKVALTDRKGVVHASAQRGYDIIKEKMEYAEQNMDEIWEAAKLAIVSVLHALPNASEFVQGIGFSGQQHGLVMVGEDGRLLRNAIIWSDQRTTEEIADIYHIIPRDTCQVVTLNSLSTGFLGVSLLWVKKHEPELFDKIHKVMLPKDYIRFKMTGEIATESSDASATGMFDPVRRCWAWDLIHRVGYPEDIFPTCRESFEIAGEINSACAKETGLKAGTKVVYGGGDTPMQALGNGMTDQGCLAANIGTACQITSILDAPIYDPGFRTNTFCHTQRDRWIINGANLSGGIALKWLKNQVLHMDSFDDMSACAAKSPAGSKGLLFLPYLNGERTPYHNPDAKAVYWGMTLSHDRSDMIRAAMEGIVLGMKNSIQIFDSVGIKYDRVIASGGAARSQVFKQIMADVFDAQIYQNTNSEQASLGAAMSAAIGCGVFETMEEACESMVHLDEKTVLPDKNAHGMYQEIFGKYCELYERNVDLF